MEAIDSRIWRFICRQGNLSNRCLTCSWFNRSLCEASELRSSKVGSSAFSQTVFFKTVQICAKHSGNNPLHVQGETSQAPIADLSSLTIVRHKMAKGRHKHRFTWSSHEVQMKFTWSSLLDDFPKFSHGPVTVLSILHGSVDALVPWWLCRRARPPNNVSADWRRVPCADFRRSDFDRSWSGTICPACTPQSSSPAWPNGRKLPAQEAESRWMEGIWRLGEDLEAKSCQDTCLLEIIQLSLFVPAVYPVHHVV